MKIIGYAVPDIDYDAARANGMPILNAMKNIYEHNGDIYSGDNLGRIEYKLSNYEISNRRYRCSVWKGDNHLIDWRIYFTSK